MAAGQKTFQAVLERMPGNLGWVIVRVPVDVPKVWGVKGQLRVRGDINGFSFRTSLFPTGKGWHYLLVNKRMQQGARVRSGQKARFRLEPDTEKRAVRDPAEWSRLLQREKAIARFVAALSYSMRKYMSQWVGEPKSAASRQRRAAQMAERILATIAAERSLPPLLQRAFAANPRAWQGWRSMTAKQRRMSLLAVFYYQTPEARRRRLDKVMAEALRRAEKA